MDPMAAITSTGTCCANTIPGAHLRPWWHFVSKASNDGTSGRDLDGNLFSKDEGDTPIEQGLMTADDLSRYPFTFAHGHPFYDGAVGRLEGGSWRAHVRELAERKVAEPIPFQLLDAAEKDHTQVLEISGPQRVFFLDISKVPNGCLRFKGLVIRHGGTLLFNDAADLALNVEFILVESGALLQAGSNFDDRYRYTHALHIELTNPNGGFNHMACIASQYSYICYNPGVRRTCHKEDQFQDFTGGQEAFNNMFGKKVVANGFNGNIHLASQLPAPAKYLGTWGAVKEDDKGSCELIGSNEMLTYFNGSIPMQKKAAVQCNIETSYPLCWARLADGMYGPGTEHTDHVFLDARDCQTEDGNGVDVENLRWKVGSRVVISCRSKESYFDDTDPTGTAMQPLWLDWPQGSPDEKANRRANETIFKKPTVGVEVATIKNVSQDGGAIKVSFQNDLHFYHDSSKFKMVRTFEDEWGCKSTATCIVDTQLHIALLSRNIRVSSEINRNAKGDACNIKRWDKAAENTKGQLCGCPGETTIVPNYLTKKYTRNAHDIYKACYEDLYKDAASGPPNGGENQRFNYWGDGEGPRQPKGSWLYGTCGAEGANSILGGHTMFKFGSGAVMDGVELYRLGQAGNFGSIGRYPLHLHLSGAACSFSEYLPEGAAGKVGRGMDIVNGSCWLSFNRWYTIHGTQEANIKNCTGFVSIGSGYFLEDGTEINNTLEHNLAISCLSAPPNAYWNTAPILPSVSSDFGQPSAFWLKNSMNACFRNVACCSPNPVIGFWAVPQEIAYLRGPSSVCIGDEDLKLPALAAAGNCVPAGEKVDKSGRLGVNSSGKVPPCWTPPDFQKRLLTGKNGILLYSRSNTSVPFFRWAENVVYNMAGGMSTFPEFLANGLPNHKGLNESPGPLTAGAGPMGFYMCDEDGRRPTSVTQWLPSNGQNLCTDYHGQAVYICSQWAGGRMDFPYEPLSPRSYREINARGHTIAFEVEADVVPTIFSGWLTYNLGANANYLWGGAGWMKSAPAWLLNCCFLGYLGGEVLPMCRTNGDLPEKMQTVHYPKETSSVFSIAVGDNNWMFSSIYHVYYNVLTDAGLAIAPNPTIVGGRSTFIADSALPAFMEYASQDGSSGSPNIANCRWYFMDVPFQKMFPSVFWMKGKNRKVGFDRNRLTAMELVNFENDEVYMQYLSELPEKKETLFLPADTRKFPFIFGDDGCLFRTEEASDSAFACDHPEWMGKVANVCTGHFVTPQAIELGDLLGKALKRVPHDTTGPQGDRWDPPKSDPTWECRGRELPWDCAQKPRRRLREVKPAPASQPSTPYPVSIPAGPLPAAPIAPPVVDKHIDCDLFLVGQPGQRKLRIEVRPKEIDGVTKVEVRYSVNAKHWGAAANTQQPGGPWVHTDCAAPTVEAGDEVTYHVIIERHGVAEHHRGLSWKAS